MIDPIILAPDCVDCGCKRTIRESAKNNWITDCYRCSKKKLLNRHFLFLGDLMPYIKLYEDTGFWNQTEQKAIYEILTGEQK